MNKRPAGGRDALDLEAAVRHTRGIQPWRRVFHAAGGVAIVALVHLVGVGSTAARVVIAGALVAALSVDQVRLRSPAANAVFFRWFSALASPREAGKVASSTWYLVGALAVLLIAPPRFFLPAMLVLAFADPAASVVGRLWGSHVLGKGSWEGTVAFFLVAFAVLAPVVGFPAALVAGAAAAALEVLPSGIDDNLMVPVVTALALWAVGM